MGYFDTDAGVNEYIRLAEGYDGRALIGKLQDHLPEGSTVLELGMGPGKDLQLLQDYFEPTGSDSSEVFVNRFSKAHPQADVLVLDAITIQTDRRFDALYSNKVLHQLTKDELNQSLASQHRVLNENGVALHSLWHGEECEKYGEMLAQHYTMETFTELLSDQFEVIAHFLYAEMEDNDSLCVILKRVSG